MRAFLARYDGDRSQYGGPFAQFKCWLFGHKPQRGRLVDAIRLAPGGGIWERRIFFCARCNRALDVEWEQVR